ncbi:lactoylglutathione lyase-like lyase [Xenococcus sp. PCC 7305]|uniref:VOC family protein n=1 Tax=Xenococcus sp. PCC 7305 TaxID=102125 RepID=UPI0002AC6432|nr:VOC family protein [Xenococcus sp. PCC 7305]ELS01430.1 lactoylglutathione lyase-like lyase [Xenococcus sp. PCC 7305]
MTLTYTRAYIAIAALDITKTIDFYTKLLQLNPTKYIPNTYAEFEFSQLRLAIFQPKGDNIDEFNRPQGSSMSLCLEVIDLENAIAFLAEIGYPTSCHIITASHGQEIYACDPSGNRLILYQKN